MACSGTHLSCRQGGEIDVCPLLFHSLTVSSPNTSRVVERISCMARFLMTRKVEFRDIVGEFKIPHIKVRVILGEMFKMMD